MRKVLIITALALVATPLSAHPSSKTRPWADEADWRPVGSILSVDEKGNEAEGYVFAGSPVKAGNAVAFETLEIYNKPAFQGSSQHHEHIVADCRTFEFAKTLNFWFRPAVIGPPLLEVNSQSPARPGTPMRTAIEAACTISILDWGEFPDPYVWARAKFKHR